MSTTIMDCDPNYIRVFRIKKGLKGLEGHGNMIEYIIEGRNIVDKYYNGTYMGSYNL